MTFRLRTAFAIVTTVVTATVMATAAPAQQKDVPYWATISASEANMRTGPSQRFPIDWRYTRPGLPVKVLRVNQGWRYVEDPDGAKGWIYSQMVSQRRGAIVVGDTLAPMRAEPSAEAALKWNLEPGVVGVLGDCEAGWCAFDVDGRAGFVEAARLWGVGAP